MSSDKVCMCAGLCAVCAMGTAFDVVKKNVAIHAEPSHYTCCVVLTVG